MPGIVRLEADRHVELVVRYYFNTPVEAQIFLYKEQEQGRKLDVITQRSVLGRNTRKDIDEN